MSERYDGVVIGAGQAGGPLAKDLAKAGWKVAVIEREHAGGTCLNEGCTPTKLMVATARIAYLARRGPEYGINTGDISVDMAKIRERKRDIVESWSSGNRQGIEGTEGVTYIDGEASFIDEHTISIALNDGGTQEITAQNVFINTGQRARIPPIEGLDSIQYLTNKSVMELDEVPDHLIILGGGYIGLEFGQMFRRFGANVTIINRGEDFLAREDRDIAEAIEHILVEDGITLHKGTDSKRVSQQDGIITLSVEKEGETFDVEGSHLLVAVGRTPNTGKLNLDAAGIETDKRGYIVVNDRLETNMEHIYALGDVKGGPAFTHISYDDYRIVRDNLLKGERNSRKGRLVPYTMFMDPQLGHVGLHEHEAEAQGYNYKVATMPMNYVARASEMNETRGMMKAIVDAETHQILGATVLGVEGGEIMSILQMAMMGGLPYTALRDAVFAHPLLAESLNNLFASL